jgi:hypothetical protein
MPAFVLPCLLAVCNPEEAWQRNVGDSLALLLLLLIAAAAAHSFCKASAPQ